MNINDDYAKKREHVRIDVQIPIAIRKVSKEEKNNLFAYVIGSPKFTSVITKQTVNTLTELYDKINEKLDLIVNLLTMQQYGFYQMPVKMVNLSGGGLRTTLDEKYDTGDILEIKLFLDSPMPVGLCLYAEVVKVEEKQGKYETAVKFINLSENIRDCIVRFIFHKERMRHKE